jgi:hypothetical protein
MNTDNPTEPVIVTLKEHEEHILAKRVELFLACMSNAT